MSLGFCVDGPYEVLIVLWHVMGYNVVNIFYVVVAGNGSFSCIIWWELIIRFENNIAHS